MIRGFVQAAVPNIPNTAKKAGRRKEGGRRDEGRRKEGDVGEV